MNTFLVGDRVKLRRGYYNGEGVVTEIQPALEMNGAMISSPKYKVAWDDGDKSDWLSPYDLTLIPAVKNERKN